PCFSGGVMPEYVMFLYPIPPAILFARPGLARAYIATVYGAENTAQCNSFCAVHSETNVHCGTGGLRSGSERPRSAPGTMPRRPHDGVKAAPCRRSPRPDSAALPR